VRQIVGTYIADDPTPKPAVLEWIQAECRVGYFAEALTKFVQTQPEPFRVDLAVVEKLDPDKITLRLSCRVADHESPSPFSADSLFELNPLTLAVSRL